MNQKTKTAVSLLVIFSTFYFYLLIAGYPIFDPDTNRYIRGIYHGKDLHSTIGVMMIFYPTFVKYKFIGWYIQQALIATTSIVLFKKLFNKALRVGTIIICLIVSMYPFVVLTLSTDFFSTVCILSTILFLSKKNNKLNTLFLFLSTTAHQGNIPLALGLITIYWLIYKNKKKVTSYIGIILLVMAFNAGYNYYSTSYLTPVSPVKNTFLAARLMSRDTESLKAFAKEYPDSYIAKNKDAFIKVSKQNMPEAILWRKDSPIKRRHELFEKEAGKYIFFTIKNSPYRLFRDMVESSKKQISIKLEPMKILYENQLKDSIHQVKTYTPEDLERFTESLYYTNGHLKYTTPKATKAALLASILVSLIALVRERKESVYFLSALISFSSIMLTILIMPNISGDSPRYLLRVIFPLILTAGLYIEKIISEHPRLKQEGGK